MAEYIEREKLLQDIRESVVFTVKKGTPLPNAEMRGANKVIDRVKSATTADVVKVVRCKECKHTYINSFSAQSGVAICKFWSNRSETNILAVQQDDFCSYGELKELNNNG